MKYGPVSSYNVRWTRTIDQNPAGARAEEHLVLEVDDSDGTVQLTESVVAQLLVDAGWEREA